MAKVANRFIGLKLSVYKKIFLGCYDFHLSDVREVNVRVEHDVINELPPLVVIRDTVGI